MMIQIDEAYWLSAHGERGKMSVKKTKARTVGPLTLSTNYYRCLDRLPKSSCISLKKDLQVTDLSPDDWTDVYAPPDLSHPLFTLLSGRIRSEDLSSVAGGRGVYII